MTKNYLISIYSGIAFALGLIVSFLIVSDYDLLGRDHGYEIELKEPLKITNQRNNAIMLPVGTVLFYKKSYDNVDTFLITITTVNLSGFDKKHGKDTLSEYGYEKVGNK